MATPTPRRVLFRHSPLKEVVCQLHFPPRLKIETDPPVAFQERVRKSFPLYDVRPPQPTVIKPAGSQHKVTITIGQDPPADTMQHVFWSSNRQWRLILTRKMLALATTAYGQWETLRDQLAGPLAAFIEVYGATPFTHTCLRYRNVIHRESLGLKGVPWAELIQSWACGPLGHPDMAEAVVSGMNRWVVNLPEPGCQFDVSCGVGVDERSKTAVFLIESHTFINGQADNTNVAGHLDRLNGHAGDLFLRCLTDKLRDALRPDERP